MARLQRVREAEARAASAAAGGNKAEVFIPLSREAEDISGMAFKVALVLISLPMAGGPSRLRSSEPCRTRWPEAVP